MGISQNHPRYEELQERLNQLRASIAERREEAKKIFFELMKELGIGQDKLPEALRKQLEEIKKTLKIGTKEEEKKQNVQQTVEEITTEDILQAINSLATTPEQKAALNAKKLREELRVVVAARLAMQQSQLPQKLGDLATAKDYINVLNSASFKSATTQLGGAEKLCGQAMEMAKETVNITGKLSKIKTDLSQTVASPTPIAQNKIDPSKGPGLGS